jgi:predicted nucleic acid-binding protein
MTPPQAAAEAVLDTSIWMAIFNDEPKAVHLRDAVGTRRVVTTPIVLAELVANAKRGRVRHAEALEAVESRARYEGLTRDDALAAGEQLARLRVKGRDRVGLGDCLIYASARRIGAVLVTADADLEGEPGVVLIKG